MSVSSFKFILSQLFFSLQMKVRYPSNGARILPKENMTRYEKKIFRMIDRCQDNAIPFYKYIFLSDKRDYYTFLDVTRPLTEKESLLYQKVCQRLNKASVQVKKLIAFKKLLELSGAVNISEILSHENAHANVAESMGCNFQGYSITCIKLPFNRFYFRASAAFSVPNNLLSQKKELIGLVCVAPFLYEDDKLSDTDKKGIEFLES